MDYILHKNGSWDIIGSTITLKHAYPAVQGIPVSPVSVTVTDNTAIYQLAQGRIELGFCRRDHDIGVTCRALGMAGVHDIEILADAEAEHVEKVFIQGFGMAGPSGCRTLTEETLESNGLVALFNRQGAFLVYVRDHRRYINRYQVTKTGKLFTDEKVYVCGGFNLEGTACNEIELPPVWFTESDTPEDGLRYCAGKIAAFMGARTIKPPVFHWCSWYYLYENFSQNILEEYMDCFQTVEGAGFCYIQIDAGYTAHLGDWLTPNHRFPQGLRKAAETIRSAGYRPGIWIGPFIAGDQSELVKNHPDWILHDLEGGPVTEIRSYNEPKIWGNTDCNYYVLDTSHPQALSYLREVFRTFREWGFTLFKTDFMFWNMHDTAKVKRYDSSLTSVEIFRNTLAMIREAIGEESYLLGCIAPFLPFIGYADGMRIAGDVGAGWAEDYGPVNMIRELEADSYFNNVYWQNDPDAVLLRETDIFLKPHEIESLALLQALSGGAVTTSDPVHKIAPERMKLLRFITPKEKVSPQFPYFAKDRQEIVILHSLRQGKLLFAMNPGEGPLTVIYFFGEITGEKEWYVRKYNDTVSEKKEFYTQVLQPHESVLLFLTRKPLEKEPENLWEW